MCEIFAFQPGLNSVAYGRIRLLNTVAALRLFTPFGASVRNRSAFGSAALRLQCRSELKKYDIKEDL
ncbi:hypothetical protein [Methylocystis sp. SC2]|uniref:hypothetical protein n=1 Tax=Methylocystis sp. (strain SC2) TaxID=187303 RepID=UPI00027AEB77|nr:hypothetical protein [Methylocystis sp. SC2]CCJ06856.1 Hypothetical protein BN69_1405 [Methylocystis sp. SC2]